MQIVVELCLVETIHLFIEQVEQNLVIPEVGHIEKGDKAVGIYGQEVFVADFFNYPGRELIGEHQVRFQVHSVHYVHHIVPSSAFVIYFQ